MSGLPKIALARLKADPKSASTALGPDAFQGGEHPDANLLAAFVEKALTERERTQVLNHLAQCAECREVAALTLPGEAEVVGAADRWVPVPHRTWRISIPWTALRWGAMAAVLGAVTIVVVLHPNMWKGRPEVSQATRPPVPVGSTSAPEGVSPAPSAPSSSEAAKAKAPIETPASSPEMAAVGSASGSHRELSRNDQAAHAQAQQQVALMASSRPPATFRTESVPAANIEQKKIEKGHEFAAASAPVPPPSSGLGGGTINAPEETAKANAASPAGGATVRATTQSVAVTAKAEPLGATNEKVLVVGGNAGTSSTEAAAAKATPRASAQATVQVTAEAPMLQTEAFGKKSRNRAARAAALWNVSSDGKVQRSTDRGRSYEPVQVAQGIKFRAIAALGNEVWAGGEGGALFHSADGGATWTPVAISSGAYAVTETIAAIQLHDPQHLTIIMASDSQWVSEDAGQHWQKQP